jgi:hypothetical protein
MAAGGWPSTTDGAGLPALYQTATNKQNFQFLDFVDSGGDPPTIDYAEWTIKVPCNISLSSMTANFTWTTAGILTTNSVVWAIQARAYQDGSVLDATWSTAVTVTDANNVTSYRANISANTGTFTPAGFSSGVPNLIQFRVYRDGGDAADTLTATARLICVTLNVSQTTCS